MRYIFALLLGGCYPLRDLLNRVLRFIAIKALIIKGFFDVRCMLKNTKSPQKVNEKLLLRIIRRNRNTEYGKLHNFKDIHSVEDYKKKIPIQRYEDFRAFVERMYYDNESNLLTADKAVGFARSSGSVGKPKLIPKTNRDVRIYTKYTVTRFLYLADNYLRKEGKRRMKPARGMNLITRYDIFSPHGLPATNVGDIPARKYFFVFPYILNLPLGKQFASDEIDVKYAFSRFALEDEDTSYLFYVFSKGVAELIEYIRDNWQMLADDIENGTIDESIRVRDDIHKQLEKLMKPNPKRAAEVRKQCEKGFDETILLRLWPNLSVISAIGTSPVFEGYTSVIHRYSEGVPYDYSIYGASEALMAAAYEINNSDQVLLPDSCYFEFVDPDDEEAEHTLSIEELEVGKDYEVIITNQSGFYRYRFNDIIRVTGYCNKCPTITFVQRKGQLLNITGEKTNYEQMAAALCQLEQVAETKINEWVTFIDRGEKQYRYGILLETEGCRDLGGFSDRFEDILREVNPQYLYYEGNDLIEPPVLLMQKPGSHEEWKRARVAAGATEDQVKPVHILDTEDKREFFLSRVI